MNTETITKENALVSTMMDGRRVFCLVYTYEAHAAKTAMAAAFIPKEWEVYYCVDEKDAEMPIPARGKRIIRNFPRGGQLRYFDALIGMRDVFLEFAGIMGERDILVKLDADTMLYRPWAFIAPFLADVDFTYVRRNFNEGRFTANGCCYALGKRAIERLRRLPTERFEELARRWEGHEDKVFSSFITTQNVDLTFCQLDKAKCDWQYCRNRSADTYLFHAGYFKNAETLEEAARVAKERGVDFGDEVIEEIRRATEWTKERINSRKR